MATSKGYLEYVLEQLSGLPEISHRAMMGEYVLYYREKVIGGIYDDRLLLKPTKAAEKMLPDAERDIPYEGAKEMLLVDKMRIPMGDIVKVEAPGKTFETRWEDQSAD